MSRQLGVEAEAFACDYLKAEGLTWVESNYRCRWGEIDLIMRQQDVLVFVEVRSRQSKLFGGAIASVTAGKQKKLIKSAWDYLQSQRLKNNYALRFDVLALDGNPPQINWIKNAFGCEFW